MIRFVRVWRSVAVAAAILQLIWTGAAWAKFALPPQIQATPVDMATATQSVGFAKIGFEVAPGQPVGVWRATVFCLKMGTLTWVPLRAGIDDTLAALFVSEMRAAKVKVAGGTDDLFNDSAASARYLAAANVKKIDADLCGGEDTLIGGAIADVEWQIYSTLDRKIVARIMTRGGAKGVLSKDTMSQLILDTFTQNVRGLINAPEFRALLADASPPPGGVIAPVDRKLITLPVAAQPPPVTDASGSVVAIFTGEGMGSGFVLADGYLLTNSHVVGDAHTVRIKWPDGLETSGDVLRSERRRDIALVSTDTRGRPALGLRSSSIAPGETVFAIGTPLDPKFQNTLTRGVVSAMRTIDGLFFIQSDVMVNHGNSGGPLLDDKGRVVGVTVIGLQIDNAPTGINLFIPIRDALDFLSLKVATGP